MNLDDWARLMHMNIESWFAMQDNSQSPTAECKEPIGENNGVDCQDNCCWLESKDVLSSLNMTNKSEMVHCFVMECLPMGWWVVGLIPHGGPI